MLKKSMSEYFSRVLLVTATLWVLTGSAAFAGQVPVQQQTSASNSVSGQDDSVQTSASHHYQSPAERAKDDLLITEVKSSLAQDGVANEYPVAVDCDHGKIRLSGVVGSAEDARHAGDIAAAAPGVIAVVNQLTWRK
jgi:osmotically-inducible protein OsmY